MRRSLWPKSFHYFENVQLFLVSLCVLISILVGALFYILYARTDQSMVQRLREQASNYADFIKHAKEWNFDYGGVYVEKQKGVDSNVYLKKLGIDPDVSASGGRTFTIRNHAIMVQEISRSSEEQEGVKFRIVSLKPLNPEYFPDEFEHGAIRTFERSGQELYRIEQRPGKHPIFRYVQPLWVEKSCLECHGDQGFILGGILGVVSISIPMDDLVIESRATKTYILVAAIITICCIVVLVYVLTWRLVINLDIVQKRLKQLAATDELTGLKNRRTIMGRLDEEFLRAGRQEQPLSVITLDVDHFKRLNDAYGHPFGDVVLKCVAERMEKILRGYDSIGRIGGEEFLIVAPGSPLDEAELLARRVVKAIREEVIGDDTTQVTVTLSAGVTALGTNDDSVEELLKRSDAALYRAKREGRNRVVVVESPT